MSLPWGQALSLQCREYGLGSTPDPDQRHPTAALRDGEWPTRNDVRGLILFAERTPVVLQEHEI